MPSKRKTDKTPEYVQLHHGPKVKKSTAERLEKQQENASMLLWGIIGFMLLIFFVQYFAGLAL